MYYFVRWDINEKGVASSWSGRKNVDCNIWSRNSGCGVTIGDITGDGKDDLITFFVDDTNGTDKAYVCVGKTINE